MAATATHLRITVISSSQLLRPRPESGALGIGSGPAHRDATREPGWAKLTRSIIFIRTFNFQAAIILIICLPEARGCEGSPGRPPDDLIQRLGLDQALPPVLTGENMDLEAIFGDPSLRRWWLLNKALENAPLAEALKLAQAADEFLADQPETLRSELALTARASNSSVLLLSTKAPVPASTSPAHGDQHNTAQRFVPADATDVPASPPMLVIESDEEEAPTEELRARGGRRYGRLGQSGRHRALSPATRRCGRVGGRRNVSGQRAVSSGPGRVVASRQQNAAASRKARIPACADGLRLSAGEQPREG